MSRHRSHTLLLVLAALLILVADSSAVRTDVSVAIISGGNAVPVVLGTALQQAALSIVDIPETVWHWTGLSTAMNVDLGVVRGTFRTETRWTGVMSHDTVLAMQALMEPIRLRPGHTADMGLTYGTLSYQAVDVALPVSTGPWTMYLQGSALHGTQYEAFSGTGQAYRRIGQGVHFHLQTTERTGKSGAGWAVGGGVHYTGRGYRIGFEARDVAGRLVWSDGVVREGVVNSNTLVLDENGYPSFAPLTQGTWSRERLISTPSPRWSLRYDRLGRDGEAPVASFQIDSLDGTLLNVSGTLSLSPRADVTVGFLHPAPGVLVGVGWEAFKVRVASESLQLWSSRSLMLQVEYNLQF